jgi:hypothetical protein
MRRSKSLPYASLAAGVLERFSVTEPELKDFLVEMRRSEELVFAGMSPRQRKPAEGVIISSGVQL